MRLLIIFSLVFGSFLVYADKQDDKVELIISDPSKKAEGSWGKEADQVEAFQDIKIIDGLSEENTKERLEEARNFFNSSLAIYKATEKSIKEKREQHQKEKDANNRDRFEWQKKARDQNMEKEFRRMSYDGRKKAVMELVKGMDALEKIENPAATASQVYIDLKASIYREYIKHQFRLKNYNQSRDMLEKYLLLGPTFIVEAEPHKLLAMCYESQEKEANKYKNDELISKIKEEKNFHLVRYAEIAYGKDSSQFKKIEKKVSKFNSLPKECNSAKEVKELNKDEEANDQHRP